MDGKSLSLCLTLCIPMDCSPSGSTVHGILQARILEWVSCPPSGGSSHPRDQIWVSCIAGRSFTAESLGKTSVITGVFIKQKQQTRLYRTWWDNESSLEGCDHESRNSSSHQRLEEARNKFPWSLQKEPSMPLPWLQPCETHFSHWALRTTKFSLKCCFKPLY